MASIPKIVSVLTFGVLLGGGLPAHAATAADWMKADQSYEGHQSGLENEAGQLKGAIVERGETVQGESLFIEGTKAGTPFGLGGRDSKEVGVHIDTPPTGNIRQTDPRSDDERGQSAAE